MKLIREPAKDIPVVDEVDLVVVGGSCTGVFAAVRAARLGMRAAIVEKQNCFGGVATAGCVNIWHSLHDTVGEKQIIGGLTQEVLDRLEYRGAVDRGQRHLDAYRINTEELKVDLDELVVAHNIIPYLHTYYAGTIIKDEQIDAILIQNKSGRGAIRGRMFVDATGDGDVARDTGLNLYEPESLQPPTTCAKVQGFSSLQGFNWQQAIREHGAEFDLAPDWGWGSSIPGLSDIMLRADTHVFGHNVSVGSELSVSEIEGRRQVRAIIDLLNKYGPEGVKLSLVDLAATIGARESKRVSCKYCMSGEDVLMGRRFEDAIANGSYRVDTHHADGPGITFRYLDGTEVVFAERGAAPKEGRWRDPIEQDPTFYQIPWRSLLQDKVPNLLLAGRMLDADKTAFSAVRVMVNMNQTGEAAGVACALAIRHNQTVQELAPQLVRQTLSEGGSVII